VYFCGAYFAQKDRKMGQALPHKKVKLIIGFIFNDETVLKKAEVLISKKFGPIDFHSQIIDFLHTDYYNKEFGENLKRKFISLKYLINPENIYKVKLITNNIEHRLSSYGKRMVNIDPGYITLSKMILLTTKDYGHRVYLQKGIYAESTLKFHKDTYQGWETTYSDYRSNSYIEVFNRIRDLYKKQLIGT
jgi:hypothetical protein